MSADSSMAIVKKSIPEKRVRSFLFQILYDVVMMRKKIRRHGELLEQFKEKDEVTCRSADSQRIRIGF